MFTGCTTCMVSHLQNGLNIPGQDMWNLSSCKFKTSKSQTRNQTFQDRLLSRLQNILNCHLSDKEADNLAMARIGPILDRGHKDNLNNNDHHQLVKSFSISVFWARPLGGRMPRLWHPPLLLLPLLLNLASRFVSIVFFYILAHFLFVNSVVYLCVISLFLLSLPPKCLSLPYTRLYFKSLTILFQIVKLVICTVRTFQKYSLGRP